MEFIWDVFFKGLVIGIIHYIILGVLYMNPFVEKVYKDAQEKYPSVKMRNSTSGYLSKQFFGTQIEIWIISAGFLYLKDFLPFQPIETALILGLIFAGIRIYERWWNMYIQTTYPGNLLAIEFINGTVGTFIITIGLSYIP